MSIRYVQLRWTFAVTALILLNSLPSRGQHTAALKAPAFRTIEGLFTIAYEQALSKHLSADLSLQGGNYIKERLNRFEEFNVSGIGAIGALRYYPFAKKVFAPRGFFGYAAMRYIRFRESFLYVTSGDRFTVGGNIINAGAGIGYKFTYHRIGLEAFVGWGVGRVRSDDDQYRSNIPEFYRSSIEWAEGDFPQLDVALCYMFSPFSKD
jgi:hypothetical protein